jgi:inward rectifier potassium channel
MAKRIKDPGLGSKYDGKTKRLINQDGSFNIKKIGIDSNIRDTYHSLINMTWAKFLLLALLAIFIINNVFALVYVAIGVEHLKGDIEGDTLDNILQAFYFSFQTFTTVGYGQIVPTGVIINLVAFLESTTGLMVFAIITGLLYGRFAKPNMRILYSNKALIAPYKNGWAFMFRITNMRKSMLIELNASVSMSIVEDVNNVKIRRYYRLPLEIKSIEFFPASWTIVHAINESSELNELDLNELKKMEAEFIIQLKGFDQTFSQSVHSHYSYICGEVVVGAKFKPAYSYDNDGTMLLPIDQFHEYENVDYTP